jgi:hypothetical protein
MHLQPILRAEPHAKNTNSVVFIFDGHNLWINGDRILAAEKQ